MRFVLIYWLWRLVVSKRIYLPDVTTIHLFMTNNPAIFKMYIITYTVGNTVNTTTEDEQIIMNQCFL